MENTVQEQTPDRFERVMGETRGSDRADDPIAVLSIVISTPVAYYEDDDDLAAGLVRRMADSAEALQAFAPVISKLTAAGWKLSRPSVEGDEEGYQDIFIELRKRFSTPEHAQADARECASMLSEEYTISLGWNEKENFDGPAHEAVDWWGELS